MPWWTDVFQAALSPGVDDVLLAVGRPPLVRRGERLEALGTLPLTAAQTMALAEAITPPLGLRRLHALGRVDFIYPLDPPVCLEVQCHKFRDRVWLALRRSPQPLPHGRDPEER